MTITFGEITITPYNIIHGPEIWLALCAVCACAAVKIIVASIAYFTRKDDDDKH